MTTEKIKAFLWEETNIVNLFDVYTIGNWKE